MNAEELKKQMSDAAFNFIGVLAILSEIAVNSGEVKPQEAILIADKILGTMYKTSREEILAQKLKPKGDK